MKGLIFAQNNEASNKASDEKDLDRINRHLRILNQYFDL
jgi:hypothetical protein